MKRLLGWDGRAGDRSVFVQRNCIVERGYVGLWGGGGCGGKGEDAVE